MLNVIRNEFSGWAFGEILWFFLVCSAITAVSFYMGDTGIGIVSAVSGAACVVLTGKGKLSAYAFGIVNCILYGCISYKQALYGETMLNVLYYLPMQFYGFTVWFKNMSGGNHEVKRRRMDWIDRADKLTMIAVGTTVYGLVLGIMRDPMPYTDAFTTVASVFAMWLSCERYSEQWYLWIAIDIASVGMWWSRYCANGENAATLLMWIVFLANAIYGCVKWELDVQRVSK